MRVQGRVGARTAPPHPQRHGRPATAQSAEGTAVIDSHGGSASTNRIGGMCDESGGLVSGELRQWQARGGAGFWSAANEELRGRARGDAAANGRRARCACAAGGQCGAAGRRRRGAMEQGYGGRCGALPGSRGERPFPRPGRGGSVRFGSFLTALQQQQRRRRGGQPLREVLCPPPMTSGAGR